MPPNVDRILAAHDFYELYMPSPTPPAARPRELLICFSHLRWNFVYQRPQHLMSRFARLFDVLFFEEPLYDGEEPWLENRQELAGLHILVPHLRAGCEQPAEEMKALLDAHLKSCDKAPSVLWYYTPMSLQFSAHLPRRQVVYDCMDELSAFRGAPPEMLIMERRLLGMADIVFTGGHSLYEAKRNLHGNVHPFCSSVDVEHFGQARRPCKEPADLAPIPRPRLGFHGVIDERMDIELVEAMARRRPDWHFVFVGPVVKIPAESLPRLDNIHYLGPKSYADLPAYLAGWDVAIMPFALNESTRYISPTKTPEYLAGGRPVVSTPVADVVRIYGRNPAVKIAENDESIIAAVEAALAMSPAQVQNHADAALGNMSWDTTWAAMHEHMQQARAHPKPDHEASHSGSRQKPHFDVLIVGAGFAGSVMAERLAFGSGKKVLLIDRRPHIGGNAYDHPNDEGILVHRYGPHIFHTNAEPVMEYLSRFTAWRPYEHRVLANVDDMLVPIPINITTLERLYGRPYTAAEAEAFLKDRAEAVPEIRSAEDVVVSTVGRELYEKFFRGYTTKQWGRDPSRLDKSVTARIPTRCNRDDRYFTDRYQCMPLHGYTKMFERMLDHPNIRIRLGCDFAAVREQVVFDHLVYTGPLDEYFDFRHGRLPYRSLRFEHITLDTPQFQPVAVVNFPSASVPYTRITEYRHLTGQPGLRTSVSYEYPSAEGDPYYPIPCPESDSMRAKYDALVDEEPDVTFLGRLGTYRYYNMDQVVAQALAAYSRMENLNGIRGALEDSSPDNAVARTA